MRRPLLHFLLGGALCFAAARAWLRPAVAPAAGSDDELLWAAAVATGVDRDDAAVRDRLARLATFVGEDAGDAAARAETARRLGLDRGDLVVRRHLAQMMQLAAEQGGPVGPLDDATLEAWMAAHPERVALPPRVRLVQVFVGRERHGAGAEAEAARLLARLRAGAVSADAAGDPFPGGGRVGPASADALARRFGRAFADVVADAPADAWIGPVASSWGLHLVQVVERVPARMPSLDEVRGQVVHAVLRERGRRQAAAQLAALRAAPR
jgi:hypothetical protein